VGTDEGDQVVGMFVGSTKLSSNLSSNTLENNPDAHRNKKNEVGLHSCCDRSEKKTLPDPFSSAAVLKFLVFFLDFFWIFLDFIFCDGEKMSLQQHFPNSLLIQLLKLLSFAFAIESCLGLPCTVLGVWKNRAWKEESMDGITVDFKVDFRESGRAELDWVFNLPKGKGGGALKCAVNGFGPWDIKKIKRDNETLTLVKFALTAYGGKGACMDDFQDLFDDGKFIVGPNCDYLQKLPSSSSKNGQYLTRTGEVPGDSLAVWVIVLIAVLGVVAIALMVAGGYYLYRHRRENFLKVTDEPSSSTA
jgi:hypothetical protein